jgi:beta-glucosidase
MNGKLACALMAGAAMVCGVQAQAQGHEQVVTAQDMDAAARRAAATVAQMDPAERVVLTHGIMPLPLFPNSPPIPEGAIPGAGYVNGIPRLGIPALTETDASLGVSWVMGARGDGATALPSGVALASSWNPDVLYNGGVMIGAEARAKGFNVLLAGGANLMRDPRNGRTFEYLSEDPLLTGALVAASINGIQSNHIISTIKHVALNGQETGRKFVDIRISDAAARESDLLAFQIGMERSQPGSVMCAYNRVNGEQACSSNYLLNQVLKNDWGWRGFVMSDWGAVPALDAALNGLDQQSGAQLDPDVFFDDTLLAAAASDPAYAARLQDMNTRILTAIYAAGLDQHPVAPGGTIDFAAHARVSEEAARQGIVLLKNDRDILPLAASANRILVVGGFADGGVLSGGGSSQVHVEGGPAITVPMSAAGGPLAAFMSQQYHRSSPLAAIRARAPEAAVRFLNGRYISEAVTQAANADVVIVFATQWAGEGMDQPDLSLPQGQDALVAALAAANANTIVVLETGGPVLMPWLDQAGAVIEAWYPGSRGGEAIAAVLFGDANPSGHLPITFSRGAEQLPRPVLDGFAELETDFSGNPPTPDAQLSANYDIEGSDVGYRWNARQGQQALFPFGYGLSYTTFSQSGFTTDGRSATFTVTNTGERQGADVAQVYLLARGDETKQRLVGFARVDLAPGESRQVTEEFDQRLLADWSGNGWSIPAGDYRFGLATDAETIVAEQTVRVRARRWRD